MDDRLVFLVSPPRSGSTLLQRILDSHTDIFSPPEPHLLTPLAHLGFWHNVDKAPYDHLNSAESLRGLVAGLPGGEQDYVDACRAYADTVYGRLLAPSGKRLLLDKTPAYALVLDVVARLYPRARYVVLTRHPAAIFSSYASSFFAGDFAAAQAFNPVLNRYVPAIARFLRDAAVPKLHVSYEQLVAAPEDTVRAVYAFLGLENQSETLNYGAHSHSTAGRGDPLGVTKHNRPVASSLDKWAEELGADAEKLGFVRRIVDGLDPADLATWGYAQAELWSALERVTPKAARPPQWWKDPYLRERKLLLMLRRNVRGGGVGRMLERVRFYCDVLLRE